MFDADDLQGLGVPLPPTLVVAALTTMLKESLKAEARHGGISPFHLSPTNPFGKQRTN